MLFSVLGIVAAFIALFTLQEESHRQAMALWPGAYFITRFGVI